MAKHLKPWIWQQPNWPEFSWDTEALAKPLAVARRAQGEVLGMAKLLDGATNANAQAEVLMQEGIATSAIEGEKFDPNALRSSLARKLGLPTAGLPTATRYVDGLVEVMFDATHHFQKPLSLKRLCAWQAALFPTGRSGLHEIRVGKLRGKQSMQIVSGAIGREHVHYEAPPRVKLEKEMRHFLEWFNQPPPELDGLLRAGLAHGWFELIHPFDDGNGRVGRALLDRALAQDEQRSVRLYSMSARFMMVRNEYYEALGTLSRGKLDVTEWLGWFLSQVEQAARSSEQIVHHVLYKTRFWLRHSQSMLNQRQCKALNAMLDAGAAGFIGGMTNRKYANLCKASAATAQRDLAQLVELECLVLTGAGRNARYELVPFTK